MKEVMAVKMRGIVTNDRREIADYLGRGGNEITYYTMDDVNEKIRLGTVGRWEYIAMARPLFLVNDQGEICAPPNIIERGDIDPTEGCDD